MPNSVFITGRRRLAGHVTLAGYKHSSVVLLNAALLCKGRSRLANVPDIQDIRALTEIARELGCKVYSEAAVTDIDASNLSNSISLSNWARTIHGSLYLVPVLVARTGRAKLFQPGGCRIGERPVAHVLSTLEKMGAKKVARKKEIWLEAPDGLEGTLFDLRSIPPKEHSGRTKAALLAGALARGATQILAPFQAQEIEDLASFLGKAGAKIIKDKDSITILGQSELTGCAHTVTADFFEFATIACAVQAAGGRVYLQPSPPQAHFVEEIQLLHDCGISMKEVDDTIMVSSGEVNPVRFSCPPIYSDLHPIITAILWRADGTSVIRDDVWPERFDHIAGLQSLGANIEREGNTAYVSGPSVLQGNDLKANDLRSAAAQLVAALGAVGKSSLRGTEHLNRGYSDLPSKLCALGASIEEVKT